MVIYLCHTLLWCLTVVPGVQTPQRSPKSVLPMLHGVGWGCVTWTKWRRGIMENCRRGVAPRVREKWHCSWRPRVVFREVTHIMHWLKLKSLVWQIYSRGIFVHHETSCHSFVRRQSVFLPYAISLLAWDEFGRYGLKMFDYLCLILESGQANGLRTMPWMEWFIFGI